MRVVDEDEAAVTGAEIFVGSGVADAEAMRLPFMRNSGWGVVAAEGRNGIWRYVGYPYLSMTAASRLLQVEARRRWPCGVAWCTSWAKLAGEQRRSEDCCCCW